MIKDSSGQNNYEVQQSHHERIEKQDAFSARCYTAQKTCNKKEEKDCPANLGLNMEETGHPRLDRIFKGVFVQKPLAMQPASPAMRALQYLCLCQQIQAPGLIWSLRDHSAKSMKALLPGLEVSTNSSTTL
jgi:hypothetical protein